MRRNAGNVLLYSREVKDITKYNITEPWIRFDRYHDDSCKGRGRMNTGDTSYFKANIDDIRYMLRKDGPLAGHGDHVIHE
jgi:hypothetical protein